MASNYAEMGSSFFSWIILAFLISSQCDASRFNTQRCPPSLPRNDFLRTVGEKCYLFYREEKFWAEARDYCRQSGGELITIQTREIQGMVERAMYELWSNNGMWMGASDDHDEGDWRWVTGERIGYSNWDSNQPSCFLPDFLCHEDCGVVRKDERYRWHDYLCHATPYQYGFACQYDMLPPTTTRPTTTKPTTITTTTTTTTTPTTSKTTEIIRPTRPPPKDMTARRLSTKKTSPKLSSTATSPVQVVNDSMAVGLDPANLRNVESQRLSERESGLQTGGVVGLVISFFIVFLAGLIVGIVMCRRRYRRKYSEEVMGGFNNVLYTAAPRQPVFERVKQTNVMVAAAAYDAEEDADENRYCTIEEVQACAKKVNLPTAKELDLCQTSKSDVDNHYETVQSESEDLEGGGASGNEAPPPYPGRHFAGFQPEFLKKSSDVSEAYSNNLYGYSG